MELVKVAVKLMPKNPGLKNYMSRQFCLKCYYRTITKLGFGKKKKLKIHLYELKKNEFKTLI